MDTEQLSTTASVVNGPALPDPLADNAAGVVLKNQADTAQETNIQLLNTVKEDASVEGNGDGNGQVPPGQTEDEDGNIVNPGGHMPPGLNRGEKGEKPDNPNKPDKPANPGTEDSADKKANKEGKGTHKYGYDSLNRMTSSNIAGTTTTYTYDTLGNLVLEKTKNKVVDYQYNELNQLTKKKEGNQSYTYTYDKRGNRVAETGKKESRSYLYDETNRMVEGTNWKGDKSAYTYNGLGLRVNNTQTTHAGKVYTRDYVIDYTSFENDDLMVFAEGNGQLEYEQKHVYAGSERIEQFTDKGNWERTLYVHEDVMGSTRYYTKANGQSFAELTYDAWGMPQSPNKLLNNDHGNYVSAAFTGHIYDTTLDIYFAEARFYDANNRTWLAIDPIKDGGNWYQYCYSNPTTFWDLLGLSSDKSGFGKYTCNSYIEPFIWYVDDINTKMKEISEKISATNDSIERLVLSKALRNLYRIEYKMKYVAFGVSDDLIEFIKRYETGKGPDGKYLPEGEPALTPYYAEGDPAGTLTIGWGHHMKGDDYFIFKTTDGGDVKVNLFDKNTTITRDQAEQILQYDITDRERKFNEKIGAINTKIYENNKNGQPFTPYIAFTQNQYDAFFDLMFNIGEGIFDDHDLPAYLEKADFSDPEDLKLQFGDYSNHQNSGIMLRRADELDIILYGEYERNYEDYMRHGDIWAKLSGT